MLQIMFTSPREIIQKNMNNSKNKSVLCISNINFLSYITFIYTIYTRFSFLLTEKAV